MFENNRKSLIQHWKRSQLLLHFEWPKVDWKCPKWSKVLPDRSAFRQQKMVGNAQIQKFKWDILRNFQSMCVRETESLCHPATVIFVAKINQMKNVRSTQLDPDTTAREKNTFRDPAFLSLFSAFEFFVLEFYAASLWSPWWLLLFHAKNECHSKYAHWLKTTEIISLEFCHFPSIFVPLKIDLPGTVLTELLSTQNVDQWDLFYDFQTRWVCR